MDPHRPESALPQELTIGLASAKQRIEHTTRSGEQVSPLEIMEQRAREQTRLKMTEDRTKWEGRFPSLSTITSRIWKFGIGETATYTKEKNHSLKMLAESGIQMTNLPHSFVEQVDTLARERVRANRTGRRGKVLGWMRDAFAEATFQEKDLHRERIAIVRELREAADNPNDPARQQFLRNHQLGSAFSEILRGDYQASEALAKRVSSQYGNEVLHSAVGEKKTQQAVELQGPIKDFFTRQIMTPLLQEGLRNGNLSDQSLMNARRQLQEFYFSPTFLNWYNNADPSIRTNLNISLSYGTDLIPMIQETLLPQLLQMKDHMQSTGNLDQYLQNVVLKVQAGTLEAGQKGVIEEGFAERHAARAITNQRVLDIYRNLQNRPQLVPDTYLEAARNRADIVGAITRVGTNPVIGGLLAGAGLFAAQRFAGIAGNTFMPIIGGSLAAGAFRAAQERRTFTREFEEHNVESELGYQFDRNASRREQMRNLEFHKRDMQSELTVPLSQFTERMKAGEQLNRSEITRLLGYLSDTKARFELMDQYGMGLLSSAHPQRYQAERTQLEFARAEAVVQLRHFIQADATRLTDVQNALGMGGQSIDTILSNLTQSQRDHLERGTGISPQQSAALGHLSISEQQSILRRAEAFRRTRNTRMATSFAVTALTSVAGGLLLQEGIAVGKRLAGDTTVGNTVLENAAKKVSASFSSAKNALDASTQQLIHDPGTFLQDGMKSTSQFLSSTPDVSGFIDDTKQTMNELLDPGKVPGLDIKETKELYSNPGQVEIDSNTFIKSDGAGNFSLVDGSGKVIPSADVRIESDGTIIFKDQFTHLPPEVQDMVTDQGMGYSEVDAGRGPGFGKDQVIEMFHRPDPYGKLEVAPGIFLQTDMDHHASLWDAHGQRIDTPAMFLTGDGHIIIDSAPSGLNPDVKKVFENLGVQILENKTPQFSTYAQVEQLMQEGRHHTFAKGDLIFDINSGKDGQFSIMHYPSGFDTNGEPKVQIHGFLKKDGNGQLYFDIDRAFGSNKDLSTDRLKILTDELRQDGWNVSETKIEGSTKEVSITDYYKEKDMLHQAKREFWHDNSTPLRNLNGRILGADGKELQFHHRVLPDGKVEVDFSQMKSQILGNGRGLNFDGSVDNQYGRLARDIVTLPNGQTSFENFEVLVTPNKVADDAREVIVFNAKNHPEIAQGYLRFDPQSPEARAFFNIGVDGKPQLNPFGNFQKPSFIEVSHLQSNGTRTILATSQGGAEGIRTMEVTTPPHEGYRFTPPSAASELVPPTIPPIIETQITPPELQLLEQDLLMPLPLNYRRPMESPETFIWYGYGGENAGWIERKDYEARRSETLNQDPQAHLNERDELSKYLAKQDARYVQELERLDRTIAEPMRPETRVVITIPAFGEGKIIYNTLTQYLNQKDADGNPVDPKLYEIVIFENDTEEKPKDQTEAEIRRFKADHPEIQLHYAFKRWTDQERSAKVDTVGNGRKYICDLALLRSQKRTRQNGELIIINQDADLEGISPTYISDVVGQFDTKDYLDYVVGKRNIPDWALAKPNLRAGHRLWEIFDSVMRHTGGQKQTDDPGLGMEPTERKAGWPGMIGENSAMRASIYAAVGGYAPTAKVGEDMNLGDMIRVARNYDDRRFPYMNRLETIKSPRRYLAYMVQGKPLREMYDHYHEEKDIRDKDNRDLLRLIPDTLSVPRLEMDADYFYQQKHTHNHYSDLSNDQFDARFKKAMDFLGVEFIIVDGHVKITDTTKLRAGLAKY